MEKRNLSLLFILVAMGIILRILIADNIDTSLYETTFKLFPNNFSLQELSSTSFSPLGYLFSLPLIDLNFANTRFLNFNLFNDIFGLFSIISIYFLGKNFGGKNSTTVGLFASLLCALSAMLIYLGNSTNVLNASFFLSTLVLLMSSYIIIVKENSKYKYLHILSLILFLVRPISIFFIICNYLLCSAYGKNKLAKIFTQKIIHILMAIPICLVIIFAFCGKINFISFFAPYLSFISVLKPNEVANLVTTNGHFGDLIFYILIPASIATYFVIKGISKKRKETNYLTEFFGFIYPLVCLIGANLNTCSKTNLLIEIYPIFIILLSVGIPAIKNKNLKFILLGVFLGIQVFLLIANIFSNF